MPSLPERLADVMQAFKWSRSDLMRVTGQSSSVVSQWLGKGSKEITTIGSIEAAVAIERETGYSAVWVAKGIGPKMAPAHTGVAREPEKVYLSPERVLVALSDLLADVPPELRRAIGDLLHGWAADGGDPARIPAILAVLALSSKVPRRA